MIMDTKKAVREQNMFLKELIASLEDVKAGRVKDVKFE